MPNRIVREGILSSERVDKLGPDAEVLFRRLLNVVDDFGRYYAHLKLVRTACYPLRADRIQDSDIDRMLKEIQAAGLIALYQVGDKPYLQIYSPEKPRAKKSKFPQPPADANICAQAPAHAPVFVFDSVFDSVVVVESGGQAHGPRPIFLTAERSPAFERFMKAYPRRVSEDKAWEVWQAKVWELVIANGKPDSEIEAMLIERAVAFAKSPAGQDAAPGATDFRPAPHNWLLSGRFKDDPKEWLKPNGTPAQGSRRSEPTRAKVKPLAPVTPSVGDALQEMMSDRT